MITYSLHLFESCMHIIDLYFLKSYISCKLYLSYKLVLLKREVINVTLQIIYFRKVFYVCYMKYFMYSSMLCQLKVHNTIKEPGRVNLLATFKLSTFVPKLLVFMRPTLNHKKSFRKFYITKFLRFIP